MSVNEGLVKYLRTVASYYELVRPSSYIFKAKAYNNAATTVEALDTILVTESDAITIRGIGPSISKEIEEYSRRGTTEKLESLRAQAPYKEYIDLFTGVYGIGVITAKKFYDKGCRTIDDLHDHVTTKSQRIGLKYYKTINERIPHNEIKEFNVQVQEILAKYELNGIITGSFRRGCETSGDIDLMVVHSSIDFIIKILAPLLAETLSMKNLFMGITSTGRRIDIRVFKESEYPYALLHYTGSREFNIKMRNHAKQMGMLLNEYGLFDSKSNRVKIHMYKGSPELGIFEALDFEWTPPEKR